MNARFPPPPKPDAKSDLLGPLPARRVVKKAVILAAGRGRRMGKLTADRPKAALVVGDHALIDWQIAALQAAGVEEIAVVTGHGAQALAGRGVTYIHNPNWARGTQVETLLCARDWIGEEPVIVSYGDILYHPCAALALLERPGDIVIAYDADHRWLWKERFGNWLKDSETFRLGPGQVLTEIGGEPTDIEELDGQFMGLMLFTPAGLAQVARRYRAADAAEQKQLDFTRLVAALIAAGARIDTAANLLPWMEIDGAKDLIIAKRMTVRDHANGRRPAISFPGAVGEAIFDDADDELNSSADIAIDAKSTRTVVPANDPPSDKFPPGASRASPKEPTPSTRPYGVESAFAIQNWGRSGSTFVQSLFDDHSQILSTPNFYSRRYYIVWAETISALADIDKITAFLKAFPQWWDTGRIDASAGLHRLGPDRRQLAGVRHDALESHLRMTFADGRPVTRRSLFEAAHLAYALARGQALAQRGLQILFPVHGEPRSVAAAFLEDFPQARFIHTVRHPASNTASAIQHFSVNDLDLRVDTLEMAITGLFRRRNRRHGRLVTAFAERPYFRYLASRDQARVMKIEDLHQSPRMVMAGAAQWVGIDFEERLLQSTWDGKIWWNRPESGRESRFDGTKLSQNIGKRLSPSDEKKIITLARGAPIINQAYGLGRPAFPRRAAEGVGAILGPWRHERHPRRTEARCLAALLAFSPLLPKRLVTALVDAANRERFRGQLLELGSGAAAIRRKIPDERKPAAVRAILLVSPAKQGWRTRALAVLPPGDLDQPDRIATVFLDEATAPKTVADHAFWALVLTLGWAIARIGTFVRFRIMLARLLLTARGPTGSRSLKSVTQHHTQNSQIPP